MRDTKLVTNLMLEIEKDIYVDLSARQRGLYRGLLANVSVADLLEKAANIGDADSARSLMNLVMQFRKVCKISCRIRWSHSVHNRQVCNHPELFERADVVAPFSFSHFGRSGPLSREGDFITLPYSTRNPIEYAIPELLYRDGGLLDVPNERSKGLLNSACLTKLFNIWSTDWIQRSLYEEGNLYALARLYLLIPRQGTRLSHSFAFLTCLQAMRIVFM
jgi:chromatin-remodeling ATPase INO80